jgi:hypothetical protein
MRTAILISALLMSLNPRSTMAQRPNSAATEAAKETEKEQSERKLLLSAAQALHTEAVSAVSSGRPLDAQLPRKIVNRYPSALTSVPIVSNDNHSAVLTYDEAIQKTEDVMKQLGVLVNVSIQASPGRCSIKYRPVIGGAELDAGETDLSTKLDARWYIFSCNCKVPPIEQRVDCTEDKKVVFSCQ